jgi:Winged helix DNA-binding domain
VARVRTLPQAAAWVERVGLAPVFPKADLVLPSLWEAVNGDPAPNWAIREPDGTFVRWTKEMGFLWRAKDELPAQGLVCVGKHVAKVVSCVSPTVLPALYALTGRSGRPDDFRDELDGVTLEVAEAVLAEGPLTGPQLRALTGASKREVDKAVDLLHRRLVLTSAGLVEQEAGWGAIAVEILARKWTLPRRLPAIEEARRTLARLVLDAAGELTAADLAGAVGWRRREAADTLDEIAEGRDDEAGFRIWVAS